MFNRLFATYCLLMVCANMMALVEGELKERDIKPDGSEKHIITYAIEVPKTIAAAGTTDPTKQVGLFLCFHGHGGQAPHEANNVIRIMKGLKILDGYIVLGAKSQNAGWEEEADVEPVTKLAEWAKKTYPVNPRRVYTFGMSSGGNFSGVFGLARPEIIAASVIYGSGVYKRGLMAKNPKLDLPDFYMVMGLDDDDAHKNGSRGTYKTWKELGINVIYHEIEGLPHTSHHPPTNDDSILWATRLRHKTMPLAKEETELLKPIAKGAKKDGADQAACDTIALVGGFQAGTVIKDLLDHKDPTVKAITALTCNQALFGDDATAALAKKLKDADATVRKNTFAALATAANYRYKIAQETLGFVLNQKKWDIAEKLLAVQGLTYAIRFQIRGVYQDPPMFRSLIQAMNDDDLDVRKAAFAALKPIQESGYDPEADKAKRQSALAKWEEWLAKISGKDGDKTAKQ